MRFNVQRLRRNPSRRIRDPPGGASSSRRSDLFGWLWRSAKAGSNEREKQGATKGRKELVGTTRFELATSPTPRVRSTRLSHVPTCCVSASQKARAGWVQCTPACRCPRQAGRASNPHSSIMRGARPATEPGYQDHAEQAQHPCVELPAHKREPARIHRDHIRGQRLKIKHRDQGS